MTDKIVYRAADKPSHRIRSDLLGTVIPAEHGTLVRWAARNRFAPLAGVLIALVTAGGWIALHSAGAMRVLELDSIDALDDLQKIGTAVAEQRINPAHFNFGVFRP